MDRTARDGINSGVIALTNRNIKVLYNLLINYHLLLDMYDQTFAAMSFNLMQFVGIR